MPVSVTTLEGLPLLSHLPQVTLGHLAKHASEKWLSKREVVLQKGERPSALWFLLEGRLQGMDFTSDGREVGLYFIQPGDYFGEVAVIDHGVQPEFVTSLSRSRVLLVPQEPIRPILFGAPRVAESLCLRLANRLRETAAQRRILGLSNPVQRVCAQLVLLVSEKPVTAHLRISNAPTHQELAIMINASRETVTRVFQLLQGRGVVERESNDLLILAPDSLRQISEGEMDMSK